MRLSTGDTARVRTQTRDLRRPVVDVEVLRDGEVVVQEGLLPLDLTKCREISVDACVLDAEL